jgi:hypothetical protein
MAIFSFGQKNNQTGDDDNDVEVEKKIEFAQKLPAGELEGKQAAKGGDFNFLKDLEPRKPGEKEPVKIADEHPVKKEDDSEEEPVEEKKLKLKSRFSDFFRIGFGSANKNNSSRVLEVNLVKGEIVKFFDWQRGMLVILIAVFSTMAVLSGIYWGISWWGSSSQNLQTSESLQQYYKISREINSLNPKVEEVAAFQKKLEEVNFLLERHIYWTNFFNFLEDNTLSNVYFSSFGGTINGSYSLSATADSMDAIDAQTKKLLANPYIQKASVDAGSVAGQGGKPVVSFGLSFSLDPKIFLK